MAFDSKAAPGSADSGSTTDTPPDYDAIIIGAGI